MRLNILAVLKSMGLKYVVFRSWHEFMRRSGLMKLQYTTTPIKLKSITNDKFFDTPVPFLPMSAGVTAYSDEDKRSLLTEYRQILAGEYPFFSGRHLQVDHSDWLTNPENGYRYDASRHWTEIPDVDPAAGDIKFVWEKARFSWAYTVMRADRVFGTDTSVFLIDSMASFIKHAHVNCGPHWRCGQEISLRVLNWITILFYYRDTLKRNIDPEIVRNIVGSIYDQMMHVYRNRNFARIAVRNNHAITEALGLYITGLVFPFLPGAGKWKRDGKNALEKEGLYQIYDDGSYVQHSFNYQRVILQQYTFALAVVQKGGDTFSDRLLQRLNEMLRFLLTMQDDANGKLPNYGANDGAHFFPVGRGSYRDFRPQIDAFSCALNNRHCYPEGVWYDESAWFCGNSKGEISPPVKGVLNAFTSGGYYCLRGERSFVMLRCARYVHRPSQADQLHIDIWDEGRNIVRDCGSYTYNMADPFFTFFTGTGSHNTVMINGMDQMSRGPRFIWYHWTECLEARVFEENGCRCFYGKIRAYRGVIGDGVLHERSVRMYPGKLHIEIIDKIFPRQLDAEQIWNVDERSFNGYVLSARDDNNREVEEKRCKSYFSDTYGICEPAKQIRIPLVDGYLKTTIMSK